MSREYGLDAETMVYNKQMFQAVGVPFPKAGWTWDDFRSAAQRLTVGNGSTRVWGADAASLRGFAQAWMLEKVGTITQADAASIRAWTQFFATMIHTDQSVEPYNPANGASYADSPFAHGKAALSMASVQDPYLTSGKDDVAWDVAPFPALPGTSPAAPAMVRSMAIASKSQHPDAAWDFLRFFCGPEGAVAIAHSGSLLPMYNSPEIRQAWFDRTPAPPPGSETLFSTRWTLDPRAGSGKTTLLNLLGGLDRPTAGQIWFDGQELGGLTERALTALRLRRIGYVFQSFALLPLLSSQENVELPLRMAGLSARERRERAAQWLEYVGLSQRAKHRPFELSGGEQRVALARALASEPAVILADEPTGEPDMRTAAHMVALLRQTARETNVAICMTSHDPTVTEVADLVYTLVDGRLQEGEVTD